MKIVGLTGGIGSGKSTVSRMIQKHNIPIIDADLLAREVVQPNKPAYKLIVNHFSKEILLEDGTLDRTKLRNIIFSDETQRKLLNKFTHPYIRREILKLVIWYWIAGKRAVVLDTPLLIEGGLHKLMCYVIVVYCSEQIQLHRLMERDNCSEDVARQCISAQMPLKEKIKFANFVIDNSGDLSETERQVANILNKAKPSLLNWLLIWLGPPLLVSLPIMYIVTKSIK
ncbi:dephospho-CoA kinase [Gigaspora rosea]|uniref:Dephospho-CoA kinase n=1 Tax=Gigaspora rosea TaxID=44941 RepID=A0A397U5R0_9GLOM|nr:dephospho-CoA kinase [Gigaspora rosea]